MAVGCRRRLAAVASGSSGRVVDCTVLPAVCHLPSFLLSHLLLARPTRPLAQALTHTCLTPFPPPPARCCRHAGQRAPRAGPGLGAAAGPLCRGQGAARCGGGAGRPGACVCVCALGGSSGRLRWAGAGRGGRGRGRGRCGCVGMCVPAMPCHQQTSFLPFAALVPGPPPPPPPPRLRHPPPTTHHPHYRTR